MEQRRPRLQASRKLHQFRYGKVRAAADCSLTRLGGRWHVTIECATLLVVMALVAPMDIRLGAQGRLVLPASLRRALSLSAGDALVARVEDRAASCWKDTAPPWPDCRTDSPRLGARGISLPR